MPTAATFETFERELNRLVESEGAARQNAVSATDRQIDALVYDLYGLTPEAIQLVEGGQ